MFKSLKILLGNCTKVYFFETTLAVNESIVDWANESNHYVIRKHVFLLRIADLNIMNTVQDAY